MDEREIASSVLAAVDQAAYQHSVNRIATVHLAIGGRRVFDPERLQAAFAQAARGTVAEGAQLSVNVLPVRHRCMNCGLTFDGGPTETPCPNCIHPHTEMIGGEELHLVDVELAEAA
jgi:hydrogenase nickel incorporation protein HypA/HybF